jgi:signal transduction histidine kinase
MSRSRADLEIRVNERTRELRIANEERIRTLHQIVTVQEDERRRVARDLHDQLGQQMTVLRLSLESIQKQFGGLDGLSMQLGETRKLLRQLDSDVDFLAWKFRPAILDDIGIVAALDQYIGQWSARLGIPAKFDAKRLGSVRLSPDVETNYYRITQEALNNVSKHANAGNVNILLEPRDGGSVLIIEDDGIGFEPCEQLKTEKGMGLIGMRERADLIGGKFEIESVKGGGTTIYVTVPAPHDNRDGNN